MGFFVFSKGVIFLVNYNQIKDVVHSISHIYNYFILQVQLTQKLNDDTLRMNLLSIDLFEIQETLTAVEMPDRELCDKLSENINKILECFKDVSLNDSYAQLEHELKAMLIFLNRFAVFHNNNTNMNTAIAAHFHARLITCKNRLLSIIGDLVSFIHIIYIPYEAKCFICFCAAILFFALGVCATCLLWGLL